MLRADAVVISGDGETRLDLCCARNAIRTSLLHRFDALNQIYNGALDERTRLNNRFDGGLHAAMSSCAQDFSAVCTQPR